MLLYLTIIDRYINLDTRFNTDAGDLLHNITESMQIDQPFVDAHLKFVPSIGTLSTRGLTGGDDYPLGRETDRSADIELLVQCPLLQIGADLDRTSNPEPICAPSTMQLFDDWWLQNSIVGYHMLLQHYTVQYRMFV